MADLAAYRPIWRRPLEVPFGRHVIATNPPPSSGGVLIAHMLSVLERPARAAAARRGAHASRRMPRR